MENNSENKNGGHGIMVPALFVGGAIMLLVLLKLIIR